MTAAATASRASSFWSGATESSRSRIKTSAATDLALSSARSFDPGTNKALRRGRRLAGILSSQPVWGRLAFRRVLLHWLALRKAPAGPVLPKPAVIVVNSHVARGSVGGRASVFVLERLGYPVWFVPTVQLSWHAGHGRATRLVTEQTDFEGFLDGLAS